MWADAQATLNNARMDFLRRKIRRLLRLLERWRRVGYTIDLSCNLGNSSHFDVNDASQGYSCWTEEMLGWGENWYFVMPNVEGKRPDGTEYRGLAIKLGHGIAISWDGRVVRHCTSVSCPDGLESGYVGVGKDSPSFVNHLYGAFTCAKETIVRAGRAGCAANYRPVLRPDPQRERVPYKKRLNRKRRHRRKERAAGTVSESTGADEPTKEVVIAKLATANEVAAAVEPIVVRLPKLIAVESPVSLGAPIGYREPRVWAERKGEPRTAVASPVSLGAPIGYREPRVWAERKGEPRTAVASPVSLGAPIGYREPRVWAERKGEPRTAVASPVSLGAPIGYREPRVWAERKGEPRVEPRVQPGKGASRNGHGVDGKRKSVPVHLQRLTWKLAVHTLCQEKSRQALFRGLPRRLT